jgi:uncharacterized membrane protein
MMIEDISAIGWFHTLFCFVAMLAGGVNLVRTKGTPAHRIMGRLYVLAMVLQNVSALFVFEPHSHSGGSLALDRFGPFHWLALVTLAIVALASFSAPRQARLPYAYLHPAGMIVSYYLLIGGAVNEVFVRVDALRAVGFSARGPSPAVDLTHFAIILVASAVLTWFMVRVALWRRQTSVAA